MNVVVAGLLAAAESAEAGRHWSDMLIGLDPGHRFVLLLVVIGCATAIIISAVSMISGAVNMVHRRRTQAELKRDMLERGMSAEEITSVIESAPAGDAASRTTAIWRKGQAQ